MIEEILGFDKNNIQRHHDKVMQELIDYSCDLQHTLLLYTEYEDVEELTKDEYLENELELLYTILGTTTALLFVYNKLEVYEYSADVYNEMKNLYKIIMNEINPEINTDEKFRELVDKMFETYRGITQ